MTEVIMVVLGIGIAWLVALTMLVRLLGYNQDERESRPSLPATSPPSPTDHPATGPAPATHSEQRPIDRAS
jgi:hypothetical protein